MNPHPLFCPNEACPSRGVEGGGNVRPHDTRRDRWRCRTCGKTFSVRQGTPFHRLRTPEATVTLVVVLLAHGCPLQAIVAAFGLDARTVKKWCERAGRHCERVHGALVTARPMELVQVQADEVRVRLQGRVALWAAMALCVPTRLWLGGVVSVTRDKRLIRSLAAKVKACALPGPLLLLSDGLSSYVDAWRKAFRTPERTGRRGRPRMSAWPGMVIGQTVKRYEKGRVRGVEQRLAQGTPEQLGPLLGAATKINTAYIERLNATFRARLYNMARRTRSLARKPETPGAGMYLVGCLYNFCTPHRSLRARDGRGARLERTPAMAAGLATRVWTTAELLWFRVAPAPFVPKKRRGRKPKAQQQALTV